MNSPNLARRNKTCSDQQSVQSYTTSQSLYSTGQKSQVKATCKVYAEMREDESTRLALKFNQLKIVLGAQSLIFVISKFQSVKMQTYFWLLKEIPNSISQGIPKQENQLSKLLVLEKLVNSRYAIVLKCLKQRHQIKKGGIILGRIMKSKQVNLLYQIILALQKYQQPIQKTSILEQDCMESNLSISQNEEEEQSQGTLSDFEQEQSQKQYVAVKFACITMMKSIFQRKLLIYEFRFFMSLKMGVGVQQYQTQQKIIYKEKGKIKLGSLPGINDVSPNVGARKIFSLLFRKLQENFNILINAESNGTNTTIVLHEISDVCNLMDGSSPLPLHAQQSIKRVSSEEFKIMKQAESRQDSLMDITDIDVENEVQVLENSSKPLKSMIFQKNKRPSNLANAVRSYCNKQIDVQPKVAQLPKSPPREIVQPEKSKSHKVFIQIGVILLAMVFYIYI